MEDLLCLCFVLGVTPSSAQSLLLSLHWRVTPGGARGTYVGCLGWSPTEQAPYLLYYLIMPLQCCFGSQLASSSSAFVLEKNELQQEFLPWGTMNQF